MESEPGPPMPPGKEAKAELGLIVCENASGQVIKE
jgi:hypothetical protein